MLKRTYKALVIVQVYRYIRTYKCIQLYRYIRNITFRYEVLGLLGKGSFGQVLKAFDHKEQEYVAIKMVRNKAEYEKEAENEVKILRHLLEEDLAGNGNVVHMKASFVFRNHTCIVFEMMSTNLYELIKRKQFNRFRFYKLLISRSFHNIFVVNVRTGLI